MNGYFDRLFTHLPAGMDRDPQSIPSLQITGSGSVLILDDHLYASTATENVTIDLHGITVSSVVSQLPSGMSGTVLQSGMAEMLALPDHVESIATPVTLTIPQNPLWFLVGMMARMLESRRRNMVNQVAQLNLQAATSKILDWWGAALGVERYQSEPDLLYAQRIQAIKFQPNVNGMALQTLFSKLGYQTQVTDTSPGEFSVTVNLPNAPPNGFYYSTTQVSDALGMVKAAGVIANVILQGILIDTVSVTDSVSVTVNPQAWTWGSFTWGQFTWQ